MDRITTPFGFASTADEVAQGIEFSGEPVSITGGASGIGIETARTFENIGAHVTLAVRNVAAAAPVVAELVATTRHQEIQAELLDLADRGDARSSVQKSRAAE